MDKRAERQSGPGHVQPCTTGEEVWVLFEMSEFSEGFGRDEQWI